MVAALGQILLFVVCFYSKVNPQYNYVFRYIIHGKQEDLKFALENSYTADKLTSSYLVI